MRDLTVDYPAQRDALRQALVDVIDDKLDRYGCFSGDDSVHEISAKSYDGFIAHTNGGFRALVPCTLRDIECEGLTDFEESTLRTYIDSAQLDAAEEFIRQRPELAERWDEYGGELDALGWAYAEADRVESEWRDRYHNADAPELPGVEPAPRYCAEAEALREELYTCLDEWLTEGSTFFYEITAIFYEREHRRNSTGADELYIFAGINTDFEYGRERGLETAIERDYKLVRLTPARIKTIVEAFAEKL